MKTITLNILIIVTALHAISQNYNENQFWVYRFFEKDSVFVKPLNPDSVDFESDVIFIDTLKTSFLHKRLHHVYTLEKIREIYKNYKNKEFDVLINTKVYQEITKEVPKSFIFLDSINGFPYLNNICDGNIPKINFYKNLMIIEHRWEYDIYEIGKFRKKNENEYEFIAKSWNAKNNIPDTINLHYNKDIRIYRWQFPEKVYMNKIPYISENDIENYNIFVNNCSTQKIEVVFNREDLIPKYELKIIDE